MEYKNNINILSCNNNTRYVNNHTQNALKNINSKERIKLKTFHNNKNAVSKALTDEIGIPELEALYFDVYKIL